MLFIDVLSFILALIALGLIGGFIFRLLGWKLDLFQNVGGGFEWDE